MAKKSDVDIAVQAVEKAKETLMKVRIQADRDKLYTSPVFAELVRFFLSQITSAEKPQVLND